MPRELEYQNFNFGHSIPLKFQLAIWIYRGPPPSRVEYQQVCCVRNGTFTLSTMRSGTGQMWWLTTPVVAVDKLWRFRRTLITHFAPGHFYWPCLCDVFTWDQWPAEHLMNRTHNGSSRGFLRSLVDEGWDKCSLRSRRWNGCLAVQQPVTLTDCWEQSLDFSL